MQIPTPPAHGLETALTSWSIHQLLHRYCLTLDAQNFEDFAGLFTTDGVLDLNGQPVSGRAAIEQLMRGRANGRSLHLPGAIGVQMTGPSAALATSNVAVYKGPRLGPGEVLPMAPPAALAVYQDDLCLDGGIWRFARRSAKLFMIQH